MKVLVSCEVLIGEDGACAGDEGEGVVDVVGEWTWETGEKILMMGAD